MGCTIRRRAIATTPRGPWVKDNLVKELCYIGTYGLRNKTELWTHLTAAKADKKQARRLLITNNINEFRLEGRALLSRLYKIGMISGVDFNDDEDIRRCLKLVLNFDISDYLSRRLQYLVFKAGLARNVHHARNLITQHQICIKGKIVDRPAMMIRSENEGHIEINPYSVTAGTKKSRYAKKHADPKEE